MVSAVYAKTTAFFDEFVAAFTSFDGALIAQRYRVPFMAMHADGRIDCLNSAAEIAQYLQGFLDHYQAAGACACGYQALEVVEVGAGCVLATLTWQLFDHQGALVSTWRESYNLSCADEDMHIFVSIDHAA